MFRILGILDVGSMTSTPSSLTSNLWVRSRAGDGTKTAEADRPAEEGAGPQSGSDSKGGESSSNGQVDVRDGIALSEDGNFTLTHFGCS